MHIWFWLAKPVPDSALKIWAADLNTTAGVTLIDPALFQHVQAHYTAAPIFDGVDDPFPVRSDMVEKKLHCVNIVLPVPALRSHKAGTGSSNFSSKGQVGQG